MHSTALKVPTVALPATVLGADDRNTIGHIFVPSAASRHAGPMRADELMNEPAMFFPFLPDQAHSPVILNKEEVLVVTVAVPADAEETSSPDVECEHHVVVECGGHHINGMLLPRERPGAHSRVLDVLNLGSSFLVVRHGDRLHLVQKRRITRVIEVSEA
jgi:hypothetical protein